MLRATKFSMPDFYWIKILEEWSLTKHKHKMFCFQLVAKSLEKRKSDEIKI